MDPQPSPEEENSILSGVIQSQATNSRNVSQETLNKLVDLYAHPTDNLSNSSLSNRAAEFFNDYLLLAPNRLFLEVASDAKRQQDVWAWSFGQPLAGFPNFFGGECIHLSTYSFLTQSISSLPHE